VIIPSLPIGDLTFPGKAGDLQRQGMTASLIRELGDNYDAYHDFLEAQFSTLRRPQPKNFDRVEDYAAAWTRIENIVRAEITLRACRRFRKFGERLDSPVDTPLIDAQDRLLREKQ
jgi:hypothetical protein